MHRLTGKPAEKRVRGKGRQPMSPASARSDPERGERSELCPFLRKPGIKSPRQPIREIVVTSCPVGGGDLLQKSAASNNRQSPLLCRSARIRRELFPFTLGRNAIAFLPPQHGSTLLITHTGPLLIFCSATICRAIASLSSLGFTYFTGRPSRSTSSTDSALSRLLVRSACFPNSFSSTWLCHR